MSAHLHPGKRHDFVFFFEAKNSNPNGDPDAGNMPRVDPETMKGLVTDVCIKRKIRSWIEEEKEHERPHDIFIRMDRALNEKIEESEEHIEDDVPSEKKARQRWMCNQYYDVRTFGAVLSTGENSGIGRITGPMQFAISESVDPVTIQDLSITRQGITTESDFESNETGTIGRKPVVLYGLYRGHGFYNPKLAERTGFGDENDDLDLFWQALEEAFWHDQSALRSEVNMRQIYVFSHDKPRGNAPAWQLFESIEAHPDEEAMEESGTDVPRTFAHYTLPSDEDVDTPDGVSVKTLIDR